MTRRLFYVALGASAGVLLVRRAAQAAQRFTPAGVSGSVGGLGDRFGAFAAEVRLAMAEREQELRTMLGLDGTHDAVDAQAYVSPVPPGRTGGMEDDVQ